ncbi:pyrimidine utilization flavin reductase protein F [Pseudomonas alliivorans]|uniref:NADH-dependent FMN reductase RutF n=1 Tax=Pseudomonas alliivorans TaxID=2810613 RepID=UPI001AE6F5E3|nr:pyrimidine utilization flavin reductase protein F [Pseudomonas alliivorans]MBP0939171.1 pyrimidine utilization flavin reductase protein F [Pseudomonas alliivorans]MEE4877844.1 pyrimidine utilization flavin reductase protein F [Pseudomonas alliivorans]MEE4928613.1 pyrimidine utilization flavin reductase protein F [Pseudomonas alliivorans]MEE4934028.1 pyrimidine utilization flavin reductase protein F [Pseudomonas alliivorans]MEE4939160.1 pyrimidine utilization flavin reductase protein F [Pseu
MPTQSAPCTTAATAVTQLEFRDAMSSLAAAVNVITTDGPHGRAGFTATAVCSVTDQPPTLLVCINRSASVYDAFVGNGTLCVNTLGHDQQALSNLFGGKTSQAERFAGGQWLEGLTGAPLLNGAKLALDCRISQSVSVGTHDILFCEVQDIRHESQSDALVYFGRQYHPLPGVLPTR